MWKSISAAPGLKCKSTLPWIITPSTLSFGSEIGMRVVEECKCPRCGKDIHQPPKPKPPCPAPGFEKRYAVLEITRMLDTGEITARVLGPLESDAVARMRRLELTAASELRL